MNNFKECATCAEKPGSPELCNSCYSNRTTIASLEASKDNAYYERNQLVVALSKIYPSWLGWHRETAWEDGWRNIVYIRIPTKELCMKQIQGGYEARFQRQISWHIHDNDLKYFSHLKQGLEQWDGHDTEEKYRRLGSLYIKRPWLAPPLH